MTAQLTHLLDGTSTADRQVGTGASSVQLSDGTLVVMSGVAGAVPTIAWVATSGASGSVGTVNASMPVATTGQPLQYGICRDASDNIYIAAATGPTSSSSQVSLQVFTKGSGHTWTAGAFKTSNFNQAQTARMTKIAWCNTGGGTGGLGHLFLVAVGSGSVSPSYLGLDAGALLAGTVTITAASATMTVNVIPTSACNFDMAQDGFGGLSGLIASEAGSATLVGVASWAMTTSGVVSFVSFATTYAAGTMGSGTKLRLVRVSSGLYALVYRSATAGQFVVRGMSSTASVASASLAPGNTTWVAAQTWDAYADPLNAGKLWIAGLGTFSTPNETIVETPVTAIGTAPAAGTSVTTNTWNPVVADPSLAPFWFGAVKQPVASPVQRYCTVETTATGPNYALYVDEVYPVSTPSAPTLNSPLASAFQDVAAGTGFQAIYNPTDNSNQNAYAFRIKTSAGSYQYWNATSGALQGTIVWNTVVTAPGAAWTITLPSGILANGNVYNWSFASQESIANLQGAFAPDRTFTAQAAPTVTITAPTGTIATSSPGSAWTTTPGAGASQIAYRVVREHGAYGTTPGSGTQDYDSGVVASSAGTQAVAVVLANGTTYRDFVQVTETGGQTSGWGISTFTVTITPPAAPTLIAAAGTDPSTGAPRVDLQSTDNNLSGFTSLTTSIQYSDDGGATWANVRGMGQVSITLHTAVFAEDYEATLDQARQYRSWVTGIASSNVVSSAYATSSATPTSKSWWLVDPLFPTLNLAVMVADLPSLDHPVDSAVLEPLAYPGEAKTTSIVVFGAARTSSGTVQFFTAGQAARKALKLLLTARRVLLLKMPAEAAGETGAQWYAAFGTVTEARVLVGKFSYRTMEATLTEVAAP